MGLFDKVTDTLTMASKEATQRASDLSGIAKYTMSVRENEKKYNDALIELGRTFFETDPEAVKKFYPDKYFILSELSEALLKDKRELAVCKGMKICPNCGSEQEPNYLRCTVCGMEESMAAGYASQKAMMQQMQQIQQMQQPAQQQTAAASAFCTACGAGLAEGAAFCTTCGTPVK